MDRKKFFKTSIGATIAGIVGTKLDWTIPKSDLPGIGHKSFKLNFSKPMYVTGLHPYFKVGDIIHTNNRAVIYIGLLKSETVKLQLYL